MVRTAVTPPAGPTPPALATPVARGWVVTAAVAGGVFAALGILESPARPLVLLMAGLASVGGAAFVRASLTSDLGRRQYAAGAGLTAALVLVAVGVGHHLTGGLGVAAALLVCSPWTVRWVSGSR